MLMVEEWCEGWDISLNCQDQFQFGKNGEKITNYVIECENTGQLKGTDILDFQI